MAAVAPDSSPLVEVEVRKLGVERFAGLLSAERYETLLAGAERARRLLAGRTVWNVSSTARGGGVAEMLGALLPYVAGVGVGVQWLVIQGEPEFFAVTKRLHNHLHGQPGDGGRMDDAARRVYERTMAANRDGLQARVGRDDVVLFHDPQTAGLVDAVKRVGAIAIWRCHIGADRPNDLTRAAWAFLTPFLEHADHYVFTRAGHAWPVLDTGRVAIIPPSIDAFAPKNQDLASDTVTAILRQAGLIVGSSSSSDAGVSVPIDGQIATVSRRADVVEEAPVPSDAPLVTQVSRWDRLKDPVGVLDGFARHVAPYSSAHLVLAGPSTGSVADDPEAVEVLGDVRRAWASVDADARARIHLASLPMADEHENALIVNALQRRSDVVVQKSLAEGFGLTVAEAMWKGRPTVASAVGGIREQIASGRNGLLLDDPHDPVAFGRAVTTVLDDDAIASRLGNAARESVRTNYLAPRQLLQYVDLVEQLDARR